MWEEGARIYDTPRVHNNFPSHRAIFKKKSRLLILYILSRNKAFISIYKINSITNFSHIILASALRSIDIALRKCLCKSIKN